MNNDSEYSINLLNSQEIIKPLISYPEGDYIQNRNILIELEAEEKRLMLAYGISGFLTTASLFSPTYPFTTFAGGAVTGFTMEYIMRVRRIYAVTQMLLECFEDEGITITLRVQTNLAIIDLFIKMPDRRSFALLLRNNGDGAVKWREDKQKFFIYKVGKKPCKWDSMTRTIEQLKSTIYLKDLKSPLLGTSRADRNRPINKVVVLCGSTTIHPDHAPEFWSEFGRTRTLQIYKDGLTCIVEQQKLTNFLLPPEKSLEQQ
jgi:hypothetical protein